MQLHYPVTVIQKYVLTLWERIVSRNGTELSLFQQITLYLSMVLSVYISSRLIHSEISLSQVLATLTALFVTPTFYKKLDISPNTSFLIRLVLFIQQGMFWSVVFEMATL